MFIINHSDNKNQLIVNKNLLKHEQRINRKEEKAVVKLTWPMLLTTIKSSREESMHRYQIFQLFSSPTSLVFFAFYRKFTLPNDA